MVVNVRRHVAWLPVAALVVGLLVTLGLAAIGRYPVWYILVWAMPVLGAAGMGLMLRVRVPANPLGWLFLGVAFAEGLGVISEAYSARALRLPGGLAAAAAANLLEPLPLMLLPAVLLVFPDGRLPSRRWRPIAAFWVFAVVIVTLSIVVKPGAMSDYSNAATPDNPLGIRGSISTVIQVTSAIAFAGLLPVMLAAAVSLVLRFRRARGALRQQLKWFGAAATFLACAIVSGPAGLWAPWNGNLWTILWAIGLTLVVFATGIAILRYRLYEIDRLISRTLSYTLVTGVLAGVFFSLVILSTRVLPLSSPIGVAAATLTAAALFNPLRTRVQRLVDRRFNRARYNAEATVSAFRASLRDAVDLDTIQTELVTAVSSAVQPTHASIWIKPHS